MRTCWLHVGMHKTGSSSVQHNLKSIENPEGWKILSVGGRANMGPALYAMFHPNPEKLRYYVRTGATPEEITAKGNQWREELYQEIQDASTGLFIISAEELSNFSHQAIINLKTFLEPCFDQIKVIGYVRPPKAYKTSRFQELIKHGKRRFDIARVPLCYQEKFGKFDKVFGQTNVFLRKFDPPNFTNQCLVTDFCEQVGIELPPTIVIKKFNESLSLDACKILYAYRKFGPDEIVDKRSFLANLRLIKPLLEMKGPKFEVEQQLLNQSIENHQEDIAWMENRLGEKLTECKPSSANAIRDEADFLKITRESCEEYIACFNRIFDAELEIENIPNENLVNPEQVAAMVHQSRILCENIILQKHEAKLAAAKQKSIKRNWFSRQIRRITKKFGNPSK